MIEIVILGAFGGLWWPGIERGAPPPKPQPDPWWLRPLDLVAGGIGAVIAASLVRIDAATFAGVAVPIAAGAVAATLASAGVRAASR